MIPRTPETLAKILHGDIDVPQAWLGDRCLKHDGPFKQKKGKGPNGRKLCRWCRQEVPHGRRAWCNDCRSLGLCLVSWGGIKHRVTQRDGSVCALCGWNLGLIGRVLDHIQYIYYDHDYIGRYSDDYDAAWKWAHKSMGFIPGRSLTEVDHIVPMSEGGRIGLSNLRTLCRPCHIQASADGAARRAKSKRDTKAPLFNENSSP